MNHFTREKAARHSRTALFGFVLRRSLRRGRRPGSPACPCRLASACLSLGNIGCRTPKCSRGLHRLFRGHGHLLRGLLRHRDGGFARASPLWPHPPQQRSSALGRRPQQPSRRQRRRRQRRPPQWPRHCIKDVPRTAQQVIQLIAGLRDAAARRVYPPASPQILRLSRVNSTIRRSRAAESPSTWDSRW